jgi:hypothetical protein
METKLGVPLPPPDSELSKEQEVQLAGLLAKAAQQLTQQKQAAAAQQQAEQKAQDPIIQMQQRSSRYTARCRSLTVGCRKS